MHNPNPIIISMSEINFTLAAPDISPLFNFRWACTAKIIDAIPIKAGIGMHTKQQEHDSTVRITVTTIFDRILLMSFWGSVGLGCETGVVVDCIMPSVFFGTGFPQREHDTAFVSIPLPQVLEALAKPQ